MSILIARLGTYRATSARLQKLDPGEDGNFANLSLGFSLILKGKEDRERLKTQVFIALAHGVAKSTLARDNETADGPFADG
jgi:hypothetical protein